METTYPFDSPEQEKRCAHFLDFLMEWNEKINLVSRKMPKESVWVSQVLDSVHISRFALKQSSSAIHDVGSGGGFPGLVAAIIAPERLVHLYEKVQKKANFLREAVEALSLKNVRVHEGLHDGRVAGILTARAVFPKDELFAFAHRILQPKSILIVCVGGKEEVESLNPSFVAKENSTYVLPGEFGSRSAASFLKK